MQLNGFPKHARKIHKNWLFNNLSIYKINKLYHGKCFVRFFIHSLSRIRKRTSERSERMSFLIRLNEWIKNRTKHFPWSNLYIYIYIIWSKIPKEIEPWILKVGLRNSNVTEPWCANKTSIFFCILTFYINETDPGSKSSVDPIFNNAIVLSRIRSWNTGKSCQVLFVRQCLLVWIILYTTWRDMTATSFPGSSLFLENGR